MYEMFEEVFAEVMEELGLSEWYELFDSDEFAMVEERITERLGYDCYECEEFCDWERTMGEDL